MSGPDPARRDRSPRRLVSSAICLLLAVGLAAPAIGSRAITRVEVQPHASHFEVVLTTSEGDPLEVTHFSLADPPRLVFDLSGARLDQTLPDSVAIPFDGVARLRLGQFSAEPDIARLVVDLTRSDLRLEWSVAAGALPGQTVLTLRRPGPRALGEPAIVAEQGAVLVRLAGAGGLDYTVGTLEGPPRVYADIAGATVESHQHDCGEAPLRQIRTAQQPPDRGRPVARVVVELRQAQAHSVFADGDDLVIAFGPQSWALPLAAHRPAGRLRGRTIVVDPGHGGHDPGAPAIFGPPSQGPYEKEIVLDIGLRLARLLESEGATVAMTRSDDTFISLQERAALANRLKADALISIHCDSCQRPNTLSGTSVYFDHQHSAGFAAVVQRELVAALGTVDRGVRNANFAVIRRTTGPGILVETAFINNDGDRERLINPNFRERAARAMLRGLIRFLDEDAGAGEEGA